MTHLSTANVDILNEARENEGLIKDKTFTSAFWDFSEPISNLNGILNLHFQDCIFKGSFEFNNLSKLTSSISFENCKFSGYTGFRNFKIDRLTFNKCHFSRLVFNEVVSSDLLYFEDVSCEYDIVIDNVQSDKTQVVSINKSKRINTLNINSPNIENLHIRSLGTISNIKLYSVKDFSFEGSVSTVYFKRIDFRSLSFNPYNIEDIDNRRISFNEIGSINISNQSLNGLLVVNRMLIDKLIFENIDSSSGSVKFNELEITEAIFLDVTLNSFYWNNIRFYNNLIIKRCDFSSLKFSNISWPNKHRRVTNSFLGRKIPCFYFLRKQFLSEKKLISFKELTELQLERETYRQLKSASLSNNNNIEALAFYRNEMRLLWKETRVNGGLSFLDRILIFLNRWSSDFGQNWILPLFLLFFFHTLFYIWIIDFNIIWNYCYFEAGASQYFELLNPVHKTPDYLYGGKIVLEFFLRIIDSFFIYHFIRATRKFAKI